VKYKIECSMCGRDSTGLLNFRCDYCGKPLDIQVLPDFDKKRIHGNDYSLWRYREFFPYTTETDTITLGEGWTPLAHFSNKVHFKLESLNPTGSFKDRGSAVLISAIQKRIRSKRGFISEDSSGNAGASIAAYAARAGLKAKIYVPKTVSGPKFNQIQLYGAQVVKIPGSRNNVAKEAQEHEPRKFYVGHILHPLFRDGIRSLAYEIAEQLAWKAPDSIYLPVSAGTLLLGAIAGFKHLFDSDVIESMPRIVACQTSQVSPLYHRFRNLDYTPSEKISSVADALVSIDPPLLDLMARKLKEVNGDAVMVEEEEIVKAYKNLARKGFFVEPSSAVAYAGYAKQIMNKEASESDSAVIVLTGTGLKTAFKP
jgi:threonine synthase